MVLLDAHVASGQLHAAADIDLIPDSTDTQTEEEITNQPRCTLIPFPLGRASRGN